MKGNIRLDGTSELPPIEVFLGCGPDQKLDHAEYTKRGLQWVMAAWCLKEDADGE